MWFGTNKSNSQQQAMEDDSKPQRRTTWIFRHRSNTSRSSANEKNKDEMKASSSSSNAMRNSFIAGLTAGVTGTLVGHPLDSLKVWVQTGQAKGMSSISMPSAKDIPRIIRRSYAGVAGPVMTVGLIQSVNFTAYDSMRRYYYKTYDAKDSHGNDPQAYLNNDSFTCVAVSGVAAGVVVSVITQPVMMVKTKQQSQNMKFLPAIKHTFRHPLVGFGTHLFAETANRSIYFVTYEGIKRKYVDEDGNTSMWVRMIGAMTAGIACWAFIYPSDVIRSRIYAASAADQHMNAWKMVRKMHAEGGWRSFFQGFGVTLLRAGPVAAFILPVYDIVLDKLNKLPV